jgi:hypothetical protein
VQSNSENPDHDKHPAKLLASLPGFILPKQPYQGFYADPPFPCWTDNANPNPLTFYSLAADLCLAV